jgi:hypothetical protein
MILNLIFIVPMDSKNRKNIILIFLTLLLKVLSSEMDQAKTGDRSLLNGEARIFFSEFARRPSSESPLKH